MKKLLILLMVLPLFSGCITDWAFRSEPYRAQMQSIYNEVNIISEGLSAEIGKSSLDSAQAVQTDQLKKLLADLQAERAKAEALPSFRGNDEYRQALLDWIDGMLVFFQKDIIAFLAAPQTATTSDELQGSMQSLYEATKKIQESKQKVEDLMKELE